LRCKKDGAELAGVEPCLYKKRRGGATAVVEKREAYYRD
jgi:hypothetical protein